MLILFIELAVGIMFRRTEYYSTHVPGIYTLKFKFNWPARLSDFVHVELSYTVRNFIVNWLDFQKKKKNVIILVCIMYSGIL